MNYANIKVVFKRLRPPVIDLFWHSPIFVLITKRYKYKRARIWKWSISFWDNKEVTP